LVFAVLEDQTNDLHHNFGIREEYNISTFSRGMACDVYLARTEFNQTFVSLNILVVAEVTPGLSAGCHLAVSDRVRLEIWFGQDNQSQANSTFSENEDVDAHDDLIGEKENKDEMNLGSSLSLNSSTQAYTVLAILLCLVVLLVIILACVSYYRYSVICSIHNAHCFSFQLSNK
jgi:hypothetical protein